MFGLHKYINLALIVVMVICVKRLGLPSQVLEIVQRSLIQGTSYYNKNRTESVGLTAYNLGGLEPGDIEFVAAFDVANSKVGQDLSEAIFAQPNNTVRISDVEKMDVRVEKGETLDGVGRHLGQKIKVY